MDASKRKPKIDDMLYFSKIVKLKDKFDALKIYVICEISNLANKLDSI